MTGKSFRPSLSRSFRNVWWLNGLVGPKTEAIIWAKASREIPFVPWSMSTFLNLARISNGLQRIFSFIAAMYSSRLGGILSCCCWLSNWLNDSSDCDWNACEYDVPGRLPNIENLLNQMFMIVSFKRFEARSREKR